MALFCQAPGYSVIMLLNLNLDQVGLHVVKLLRFPKGSFRSASQFLHFKNIGEIINYTHSYLLIPDALMELLKDLGEKNPVYSSQNHVCTLTTVQQQP